MSRRDEHAELILGNLPDELWARLKGWARIKAQADESPTLDECVGWVKLVCKKLGADDDVLPSEVVDFYAREMLEMIAMLRRRRADGGDVNVKAS